MNWFDQADCIWGFLAGYVAKQALPRSDFASLNATIALRRRFEGRLPLFGRRLGDENDTLRPNAIALLVRLAECATRGCDACATFCARCRSIASGAACGISLATVLALGAVRRSAARPPGGSKNASAPSCH